MRPSFARRLALPALVFFATLPGESPGFAVYDSTNLAGTSRWSGEAYRGTGLHDRIQVAIEPGILDGPGGLRETPAPP